MNARSENRNPNLRESVMAPLRDRLSTDAQFRNLILSILAAALEKAVYYLPDTSFDAILQDLLPAEVKRLRLNYDETQALFISARVMRVVAKETDKVVVHPIQLLPSPDRYEHWLEKGKIIFGQGMIWNSIRCFDRAIKINPGCAEAWYQKANSLFQVGSITTGIDQSASRVWSQLDFLRGALIEAIDCFDRAIRINREYTEAIYAKGSCLVELGRPDNDFGRVREAIQCFRQVLAIDPSHKNAKLALKMCQDAL